MPQAACDNDGVDDFPSSGSPTFAGAAPSQDFTTLNDGPVNHAPVAASDFYSVDEDYGARHQLARRASRTTPMRTAIRSPLRW